MVSTPSTKHYQHSQMHITFKTPIDPDGDTDLDPLKVFAFTSVKDKKNILFCAATPQQPDICDISQ